MASRGMIRTTILSHGGMHDAQGVAGTHLQGSTPVPAVMGAIPSALGTVGTLPEPKRTVVRKPGDPAGTRRWFDDEGNPDFPPRGGPSTQRPAQPEPEPAALVETVPEAPQAAGGAPSGSVLPPPDAQPEVSDEVSQNSDDTPVAPVLDISKRKLTRATVEELRTWCAVVGIIPEEYVDSDDLVDGKLMRRLLAEKFSITM